ncbi:hypothetical protein [Bifidobacterium panos]|nr:hypothetical protein [Bifidobacterium sp. DSM 109963]
MKNMHLFALRDVLSTDFDKEKADSIRKKISLFSCKRTEHIERFAHNQMITAESYGESRSFLFLEDDTDDLVGFFTTGLTVIDWPKQVEPSEWWQSLSKKRRNVFTKGVFSSNGIMPAFTIGEIARDDRYTNEDLPGETILRHALAKILEAQRYAAGRLILVDTRRKLFDRLYREAGFEVFGTRPSPNGEGDEEFVIALLSLKNMTIR